MTGALDDLFARGPRNNAAQYDRYPQRPIIVADGRVATVMPLLFLRGLLTVASAESHSIGTYDDGWEYDSASSAVDALHAWNEHGCAGEPQGWSRHPASGRRRPDGDPDGEYVRP